LPIQNRLLLLSGLSGLGGLLFLPFLFAGLEGRPHFRPSLVTLFVALGSTLIGFVCSSAGLRWADRASLPMPILRAWEMHKAIPPGQLRRILIPGVGFGALAGVSVATVSSAFHLPANPGNLPVRLLSVFFAATITEIVAHLFILSGLVLLLKRSPLAKGNWVPLLLSSVAFVALFHGGSVGDTGTAALVFAANFSFSLLTGWLCLARGFESAVVAHAVGHLIAVGWN